jgi:lipoprotein NlpD
VQKGDTLYGIALNHGIDFKKLAEWNDIADPGSIRPGQRINLSMPAGNSQPALFAVHQQPVTTTIEPAIQPSDATIAIQESNNSIAAADTGKVKTSPKALKLPFSEQNVARLQYPANNPPVAMHSSLAPSVAIENNAKIEVAPQPESIKSDQAINYLNAEWIWPTTGKLLSSFSKNSKGVKISGQAGQPILASAAGEVVYSGHGLRGYGNLIIIKHDSTFLSAYAHNSKILVKEGEAVVKGQKIAEMGNTDTDTIQLHFEIRKHGKPVDPLEYLPNQS